MDPAEILFGEVAVGGGFLTHDQLVDCLMLQSQMPGRRIGEVAVERGYITPEQLELILERQEQRAGGVKRAEPLPTPPGSAHGFERDVSPSMEVLLTDYMDEGYSPGVLPPLGESELDVAVRKLTRSQRRVMATPLPAGAPPLDALLGGYGDNTSPRESATPSGAAPRPAEHVASEELAGRLAVQLAAESLTDEELEIDLSGFGFDPSAEQRVADQEAAERQALEQQAAERQALEQQAAAQRAEVQRAVEQRAAEMAERQYAERMRAEAAAKPPRQAERAPDPEPAPAPEGARAARLSGEVRVRPQDLTRGARLMDELTREARLRGASDIHVHTGAPPLLRVNGRLEPIGDVVSREVAAEVVAAVMTEAQWERFARAGELDFAFAMEGGGRARCNAYRQQRGDDVVLRLVPAAVPTLRALGLPDELARFTEYGTGMVLCTGPVGCGKSTTLAALTSIVANSRAGHVITIEDPIEFVFDPAARSMINQRQLGDHTISCARALRAALREDPDVIAIAELRDRETIALAMTAAETGHLVLGTLHTGDAPQTISRIINAFPASQQSQIRAMLSESLRAVISQRLVPRADGRGRAVALEVLVVNRAVANMIRDGKGPQIASAMQVGRAHGMRVLDDSLQALVKDGVISADEARRFATKPARFADGASGVQ